MAQQLLDQFGRPAYYHTGGPGFYEDTQEHSLRLARPTLDRDAAQLLSRVKYRAMLSDARWIYTTFSHVKSAVRQKSEYVASNGWFPVFTGSDMDYEAVARPALLQALAAATNKGLDYQRLWKLGCRALDRDGSFFVLRHRSARSGFPLAQIVEAHRIGNRRQTRQIVAAGPYDGATMINGIVYSDDGRELAYNYLGAQEEQDRQIPAADMMHVALSDYFSENRAFPAIAYAILDWYDAKETRNFQKIGQKVRSAISLVETNETGSNVNANPIPGSATISPQQTAAGMRVETLEAGMIRYLRADAGAQLQPLQQDLPGQSWLDFDQTIVHGAYLGMGWRSEMADLSRLKGAGIRGFADNINTTIQDTHEDLARFALADLLWRVAVLTDRGDLPAHPEWHMWSFPRPKLFDPDPGKTIEAELSKVRAGVKSMPQVIALYGGDDDAVLLSQAKWLAKRRAMARQYEVSEIELGTSSLPGDAAAAQPLDPDQEGEDQATAAAFENLKTQFDAYGVGVRAGGITPQQADEETFRSLGGWPALSPDARRAWGEDKGIRRPITLTQPGGARPAPNPAQPQDNDPADE